MPFQAQSDSLIIIPPFLQAGDTVGVLAPASRVNYEDVKPGLAVLRDQWNLHVLEGKSLTSSHYQYSGTDELRLHELQTMLSDPSVRAIIAARGGYGCSRLLDQLDFTAFRENPKWIVGFSDLTALLSHLHGLGYASLHGPMAKLLTKEGGEEATESLRKMLFGEEVAYTIPSHTYNQNGEVTAEVVGGNLCLLAHLTGSVSEPDTRGKILFIEDVGEYYYNLDRMMIQLKRAGKLDHLAGLIVGQFTDLKDNSNPSFGKGAYEILQEHTREYSYPVCYDFPTGHVPDNRAIGVGLVATLKVGRAEVSLRFLHLESTYL
ncbi:LD-carboxypeptidase [Telluribacter sp.]|jgi:muramoyltetrapeptide carboxypeptidase|uniref:S66 peptidase family protein n=1 Tax=Telluribacter sp. TaxID=1978767 RepID=UPI002E14ECD7|nr:LD-carboxypeptidase [Telluribacter sp.]